MKKSLFALAALGAFATAAQAQSSVTLYGTFDTSIQNISNAGLANGAVQGSTTAATTANLNPTTANVQAAMIDGAIATSSWGMRGSEDLGGGMKTIFNLESDSVTNNGQTHSSGLFRRAAYVGIESAMGTVSLGRQSNPFVQSSATLMPVMGNTVNGIRNVIVSSMGDQISNAISYQTPMLSGFQAKVVYGLNNTTDMDLNNGTVLAASAYYTMGALNIGAGYNKVTTPGSTSNGTLFTAAQAVSAANTTFNRTGYNIGVKYRINNEIQVGYGYWNATGDQGLGTTAYTYSANANMVGVGFQATPAILLGANYAVTSKDSTIMNLQARYSLSKRTTLYSQVQSARNGAGTTDTGNLIFGNGYGTSTNSNTTGNQNITGYVPSSGFTGLPNTTTTAIGLGVIHTF